jgi:hypothetical protein
MRYLSLFFLILRTPNMSSRTPEGTRTLSWIPLAGRCPKGTRFTSAKWPLEGTGTRKVVRIRRDTYSTQTRKVVGSRSDTGCGQGALTSSCSDTVLWLSIQTLQPRANFIGLTKTERYHIKVPTLVCDCVIIAPPNNILDNKMWNSVIFALFVSNV